MLQYKQLIEICKQSKLFSKETGFTFYDIADIDSLERLLKFENYSAIPRIGVGYEYKALTFVYTGKGWAIFRYNNNEYRLKAIKETFRSTPSLEEYIAGWF